MPVLKSHYCNEYVPITNVASHILEFSELEFVGRACHSRSEGRRTLVRTIAQLAVRSGKHSLSLYSLS